MKEFYTIKEISKLYNIGVDSIRYYEEKGLINPFRGSNNYRYYSLDDIFKLNIIRDLLDLKFSTDHIKDYLDSLDVSSSITLYETESQRIEEEIERLKEVSLSLKKRAETLEHYRDIDETKVYVNCYPRRYCYELESHIHSDAETDYVIKSLHQKHHDKLDDIADLEIGAMPVYDDLEKGIADTFQSVFFIDNEAKDDYDFYFEEGAYLSVYYRGPYTQSSNYLQSAITTAESMGYITDRKPFEIYRVDNRYSKEDMEYVTEVQVHIIGNIDKNS